MVTLKPRVYFEHVPLNIYTTSPSGTELGTGSTSGRNSEVLLSISLLISETPQIDNDRKGWSAPFQDNVALAS